MSDQDWAWRITWRGKQWTDLDLTVQHLGVLALLSGNDDWESLDVEHGIAAARAGVMDGYMRLVNMLCAFAFVDRVPEGTPEDDAQELGAKAIDEVRKVTAVELLDAFSVNQSGSAASA